MSHGIGGTAQACGAPPVRSSARTGRILVAGCGADERRELRITLEFEGHEVVEAENRERTIQEGNSGRYHVLVLDSRIAGMEPYELCRAVRRRSEVGIVVLAEGDPKEGCIDALNSGADDYLASPFVPRELQARVRAVLRRLRRFDPDGHQIVLHDRAIDLESHRIRGPGERVSRLTPKEFLVLQCLVGQANTVFTHRKLAQTVWQGDGAGEVDCMRAIIQQIRRKLEPDPENPRYILTERSVGYRFQLPLP